MGDDAQGCLGLLGFALIAALALNNWPLSIYLIAALVGWVIAYKSRDAAKKRREAKDGFTVRMIETACDDSSFMLRNMAIGLGIVLTAQILLKLTTFVSPDQFARFERSLWNFLVGLKAIVASPFVVLGFVGAALLAGVLLKTWAVAVVGGKLRRQAGAIATITATMLMFSLVTGKAAADRYPQTTEGLRAQLLSSLATVAQARREAAAYQWATAAIERKLADPEWSAAASDFARRVGTECQKTDYIAISYNEIVDSAYRAGTCDSAMVRQEAVRFLLVFLEADPIAMLGESADRQLDWLPEVEAMVEPRSERDPDAALEMGFDLRDRLTSLADLAALRRQAAALSQDADGARNAMRGGLVKVVSLWANEHLPIPGLADYLVDAVRDAALVQLARESEARIRERVAALKERRLPRALGTGLEEGRFAPNDLLDPLQRGAVAALLVAKLLPDRAKLVARFRKAGSPAAFQAGIERAWQSYVVRRQAESVRAAEARRIERQIERARTIRPARRGR